jgi:hypothetical protein
MGVVEHEALSEEARAAIREAFARGAAEQHFWDEHWSKLLEQYEGQFVAVSAGQVVAHDPTLDGLLKALKEKHLEPPEHSSVRFIRPPNEILML